MTDIALDDQARPAAKVRYHGLDALRAWAMTMGIVLHAAWIMGPGDNTAPMNDVSGSAVMQYVSLTIHTFRMQLFFVLAGLFACLLIDRRGLKGFLKNRFLRIVVPLAGFTIILSPLMMYQYTEGGLLSGATQGKVDPAEVTWAYVTSAGPSNMFLIHLWFLYYLALVIVLVVAARSAIQLIDRKELFCRGVVEKAGSVFASKWSPLVLAACTGVLLFPMKSNSGIEINAIQLYPKLPGLLSYALYFSLGWLLYRNIDKLAVVVRHWRWHLALGLLLTMPYYAYFTFTTERGYTTWGYPELVINDLHYVDGEADYPAFRTGLLDAKPDSAAELLFQKLPEPNQQFVAQNANATPNQIDGLLKEINKLVLIDPQFSEAVDTRGLRLNAKAAEVAAMPAAERSIADTQTLNRGIIEATFPGVIYSEDIYRPYYYPMRAAYSYGYSVITWLLILGCIGFSQCFFDRESRFWRYFSDSSYWFYLLHLPIQFQILIWFGNEPWHWTAKFCVYVFGTIAVLWPSYHFLVRPTWLGWILNGRCYPVWQRAARTKAAKTVQPKANVA